MPSPPASAPPGPPPEPPATARRERLRAIAARVDAILYPLLAAAAILAAARAFYGHLLVQTGGEWSAPLDDVFIHFDYARAAARGHPFEWSEGNGYSSGNTSVLYPFVLAVGYLVGFRAGSLMVFAGVVACVSLLALLLGATRLFAGLPPWAKYAAPLGMFRIGALDWTLFSGMEVAFLLGVWAGALGAAIGLGDEADPRRLRRRALALGLWGAALVLTRPEGATTVAALGAVAAVSVARRAGARSAARALAWTAVPSAVAVGLYAATNLALTGEASPNGAIVKLAIHNPYATAREAWDEWKFLFEYVVRRNVEHHFADHPAFGWIVPALAAVPLLCPRTRRAASILWAQAALWMLVVALNGQVRWQNERYTMPAVAWMVLGAALGVAVLLTPRAWRRGAPAAAWPARGDLPALLPRAAIAAFAVGTFLVHQAPRLRDQIWFFGRAARNIRDQHVVAGRLLRRLDPPPRRVLVGDAGALLWASDLPGLDAIGLGGYHRLPFARAGVHGLGATVELIERMPPADRPTHFALYPSWWGDLPVWFGRRLVGVPVEGNVICGGSEKVLYRADWRSLGTGAWPRSIGPDERVVDEIDVADLVSEREHDYSFPRPAAGFVEMKVLPDPSAPARDLFDAGRRIPAGRAERFAVRLPRSGVRARLVARTAPARDGYVEVTVNGARAGSLRFARADGWAEASVDLPPPADRRDEARVELVPAGGDWVDDHVWVVAGK